MLRRDKGKVLSATDNGHGYKIVTLRKPCGASGCIRTNFYVHRLVATAFIPQNSAQVDVDHIDYDRSNNSVENLRWVTHQENISHSRKNMRKPKLICRASTSGEKYIRIRGKSVPRYELSIKSFGIYKTFHTLREAIEYRDGVIKSARSDS